MAELLRVSTEQMDKDLGSMKEQMDKAPSILLDVQMQLQKLNNCWEGAAQATFQQEMSKSFEQLQALLNFYQSFAENFQHSSEDYKNTEQKVYEEIHSFRV